MPIEWLKLKYDFIGFSCYKHIFYRVIHLKFTTLWANSADNKLMIYFLFSQKTGFDIACKLSLMEAICMKYQNLFSGEN